jgi:type II secretory pathway pseudopilin PulG
MDIYRSSGFTIIEVSLVLGISGLLVLMALIGTGVSIQTTRFTDSSRSLHAFVQKQYDDILNGVNPRAGQEACAAGSVNTTTPQTPGTSNCLLLGKLVTLKQGATTAEAYTIVGTEPINPDYNTTDERLIYQFTPTIIRNSGVQTYQIPWQASISGSRRLVASETPAKAVDAIAMIRSPRSNRIVIYTFKEPSPSYPLATLINPDVAADENNISKPANICLKSADAFAGQSLINLTGGQGQDAIGLSFNVVAGDCDGV